MIKLFISLTFCSLTFLAYNQKELLSTWEKTVSGDHYKLNLYFDKEATYSYSSVMTQNNEAVEYIVIIDGGRFIFYNKLNHKKEMFTEVSLVGNEWRMYFNSGTMYLIRTYVKPDTPTKK